MKRRYLFQEGFGKDTGFKIFRCIQYVLVEHVLLWIGHQFIGWSVCNHEFFKIRSVQSSDLSHQLFCKPAVYKFLLFFFYQSVLQRSKWFVSFESEWVDETCQIESGCASHCTRFRKLESTSFKFKYLSVSLSVFQGILFVCFFDDHNFLQRLVFVLYSHLQCDIKSSRVIDFFDRKVDSGFSPESKSHRIISVNVDAISADGVGIGDHTFFGWNFYRWNCYHSCWVIYPAGQPDLRWGMEGGEKEKG